LKNILHRPLRARHENIHSDTEEFLSALKEGSSETYRSELVQFQQYLGGLPDPAWKASEAPSLRFFVLG
jgi:hypothetical protein